MQVRSRKHSGWSCFALWLFSRVGVILFGWQLAPNFIGDELILYDSWGRELIDVGSVSGQSWQYPPLTAPLLAGIALSGAMPWAFIAAALIADGCIQAMLIARAGRSGSWLGAWYWACAAIVVGPAIFAKLDIFSACFAVAALIAAKQPVRSGLFAAFGTLLKLWPAYTLVAVPRKEGTRALVAWAFTAIVVGGIITAVWPSSIAFVRNQADRGLEAQSLGALPFLFAKALGEDVPLVFRFGAFEIDTPLASGVDVLLTILTVSVALLGLWMWQSGRFDGVSGAESSLFLVLLSVLTSRVMSPQFNVWLVALCGALLLEVGRRGLAAVVLVAASSILTQFTYLVGYEQLRDAEMLALLLHSARIGLLVAAVALLGFRIAQTWSGLQPHVADKGN